MFNYILAARRDQRKNPLSHLLLSSNTLQRFQHLLPQLFPLSLACNNRLSAMSQQQRDKSVTLKAADNQLYVITLPLSNSFSLYQTFVHLILDLNTNFMIFFMFYEWIDCPVKLDDSGPLSRALPNLFYNLPTKRKLKKKWLICRWMWSNILVFF